MGNWDRLQSAKLNNALDLAAARQMVPDIDTLMAEQGETTVSGGDVVNAVHEGGKPKPDSWAGVFLITFLLILASLAAYAIWSSTHPVQPTPAAATQAAPTIQTLTPGTLKAGITSTNPFQQGP